MNEQGTAASDVYVTSLDEVVSFEVSICTGWEDLSVVIDLSFLDH